MLGAPAYLLATAEIVVLLAAAVLGAGRLRARLLPGLAGPAAWVAAAVLAIAILLLPAELLGTVGLFREAPYLLSVFVLSAFLLLRVPLTAEPADIAAGHAEQRAVDEGSLPPRLAAISLAAIAIAHFTIGLRLRLSTGMTGFDSTWYHGPFAAGFAQSGHTFGLQLIAPQFLAWFYPQNSELLHGVGDLVYGRDLLSPLLNLGWLLGCLTAACAIGRPFGAGPVSAAGAALMLDTGLLADQAGEARNDLVAAFFLLAAVAILVNAIAERPDRRPDLATLAVCGLAGGLAAGTKVNLLPVAMALVAALIWLAAPRTRSRAALVSGSGALLGGGYWYVRNLVHSGNPVPQVRHLGPIDLPAPAQTLGGREGHSVLSYLLDRSVFSDWLAPGLHSGLGLLWPALLLLGVVGLLACLADRSRPELRAAAFVGLVAILAWLVAPTSASGPEGMPRGFESGLRYLAPALLLGAALAPLAPALRAPGRRRALLVAIAVAFPFADASAGEWSSGYLATAVLAGVLAAIAGLILSSPGLGGSIGARRPRLGIAVAAGSLLAAVVAFGGYRVERTYLKNRYANPRFTAAGLDAAFRWAQPLSGRSIATTTTRTYPLLGRDLSNEVRYVGVERAHGGFVSPGGCRAWIKALNQGNYDYVVASRDRLGEGAPFPPEATWTANDPAATVVLRRAPTVVFSLHGRLDPSLCAPFSTSGRPEPRP